MKGFALLLALLPLAASAATITVNTTGDNTIAGDGRCTLREALANVNAAADTTAGDCVAGTGAGDAIGFSVSGTIRLALGQLTVWRDVTITSPGNQSLRIDGGNKTRVLEIAAGATQMSGMTIRRGQGAAISIPYGEDPYVYDTVYAAGGILVDKDATLELTGCTLTKNVAAMSSDSHYGVGGAIYNSGTLSLDRCTISNNTVGTQGANSFISEAAGIYNDVTGVLTLTNCVLTRNLALTGGANGGGTSAGGAISNYGTMTLTGCTLTSNQCRVRYHLFYGDTNTNYGGAIENNGVAAVDRCVLSKNLVGSGAVYGFYGYGGVGYGGAIDNNFGTLTVSNCTFTGNSVRGARESDAYGGAISNGNDATVVNSTLVGNSVRGGPHTEAYGGAIYGATEVINCTLSDNFVSNPTLYDLEGAGGGLDSVWEVTNSIIAASGPGGNCSDEVGSGGHNISDDDSCGGDPTDLINTRPMLAPLRNYGGPTATRALCTAARQPHPACTEPSPAIDAGDDSVTGPPANLSTDQRGLSRQAGAHVDIGAYEVQ